MRSWIVAVALIVAAAAYATAIPGGFVSDDDVQIVRNVQIQDGRLLWRALTSDVWSFTGSGERASNYWRPAFVSWLALNYRLFGPWAPGWHLTSLGLHGLVIVLAAAVLRRLRVSPVVGAATLWIYAVHPIGVEVVAWASGAQDLLLATFCLGSYATYLSSGHHRPLRAASWLLFACAMLSKEIAVFFPAIVAVSAWTSDDASSLRERIRRSASVALPYAIVAAVVLSMRIATVGALVRPATRAPEILGSLLSIPRVLSFYLLHPLWPLPLSPLYPVRAVEAGASALSGWLLVVLAATVAAIVLWRRGAIYRVGISWFVLFLAPVLLNLRLLEPERLVQDRYLFVPLFGFLLVVFQGLAELGRRFLPGRSRRYAYAGALLLSLAFATLTARYNFAWRDDIALWERAVQVNPDSPHALATLGFHYRVAGRSAEAQTVLDRAVELAPRSADALLEAGILAAEQGRTRRAQALLRRALDAEPNHETIPDHLGKAFVTLGRYNAAIGVFEDARERHPHLTLKNTINIALTRRAAGDAAAAAGELEAIFEQLESQPDPGLMLGLWHLGETFRQLGRREEADRSYRAYLLVTMGLADPLSRQYRPLARERLGETED